jgi:electron transfer flavoprotein alpha/beta subunit
LAYNCVVPIKQVPDTKRITGDAMNDDGTVNRGALPAIFNPEDLNALELALWIKDKFRRQSYSDNDGSACRKCNFARVALSRRR